MKKIIKAGLRIISFTLIAIISILIVGFFYLYNFTNDICANDILSVAKSIDTKHVITVFRRNCGATTSYSTQVSIKNTEKIYNSETGNILIIDDNDGRDTTGFYLSGSPVVEASWINQNEVLLKFSSNARVFKQKTNIQNIKVDYEVK